MRGAPHRSWPGTFVESNRESQQRDMVFLDGGAICGSNSAQTPSDASGPLCPASGCATSAASPARNGTTKSTEVGQIVEGVDDVARSVEGRRSDVGSNDLSLQGGTRPKRGGDQSQKSDEKRTHLGNDDDLTNGAKTCIFNPDEVFGIHRV